MEINRDLLKQVTAKTSNKQGGIGSLPRSLHKSPDTRGCDLDLIQRL
jgi:hypothetical protein